MSDTVYVEFADASGDVVHRELLPESAFASGTTTISFPRLPTTQFRLVINDEPTEWERVGSSSTPNGGKAETP